MKLHELIECVVKRKDGYHVVSKKGKHLGGPYTKAYAKHRNSMIGMFKGVR